jgi:hypothetical protein
MLCHAELVSASLDKNLSYALQETLKNLPQRMACAMLEAKQESDWSDELPADMQ